MKASIVPALLLALVASQADAQTAAGTSSVVPDGAKWELLSTVGFGTTEGVTSGPDGTIYFVDRAVKDKNPGGTIYAFDPKTKQMTKLMEPSHNALGLHFDKNGDLWIASDGEPYGPAILRRNMKTGEIKLIANTYNGKKLVQPNDLTSDSAGRIYFTDGRYTVPEETELPNAVYRIDTDGKLKQISTDALRWNGIEVSPDGKRLYVAVNNNPATPNKSGPSQDKFGLKYGGVIAYDLDANGDVSNGRVFYRNDDFGSDSTAMDSAGNLYVCMHNGFAANKKGYVVVISPAGVILDRIDMPEGTQASNVGFGRGDDKNSLYATHMFVPKFFRIPVKSEGYFVGK